MKKPTAETHEEYNLSNEQVREAEKRRISTPAGRLEQGIFILCLPKSKEGLQACFIRELGRNAQPITVKEQPLAPKKTGIPLFDFWIGNRRTTCKTSDGT